MTVPPILKRFWWPAIILPLLFFGLGLAFLPLVGIQADEVFFATAVYKLPGSTVFDAHVFHQQIPLMLLSYLGALKSWIYFPILYLVQPSYLTVRLPVLLIGAVTIALFTRLLEKAHGRTVAWVGGILLATDTVYLLTTCFDWGPVALQHLLALAGIALLFNFTSTGKRSTLFWGFFCFGLALWDKALFIWFFSGLAIAAVAVFPRELWSRCSPKNLGFAAAGLLLGALPLVVYNVASDLETFQSNSFVLSQFPSRIHALRITWDGEILFDYMAHAPWAQGRARDPDTALFDFSDEVQSLVDVRYHYHNEMEPAFCLALLLLPLLWSTRARKPMLFCLIAMAVAWLQMAVTKDAGLGAHHVVLLWPLPHWFLALAFVQAAAWRPLQRKHIGAIVLAAVVLFLTVDNLLLTNEYFYQLDAYGPTRNWNDAIFRLSEEAGHIQAEHLVVDDWGILTPLLVLHANRLPVYLADQSFLATGITDDDRNWFIRRLEQDVWIGHTTEFLQWPDANTRIARLAQGAGFEKQMIRTVPDRNGRPVFEIFRFIRSGVAASK
jgi:hypothetical protein